MGMTQSPAGGLMGGPSGMMGMDPMMFSTTDFSMSEFDTSGFGNDTTIAGMDFEREFGLFFNPGDGLDSLADMK